MKAQLVLLSVMCASTAAFAGPEKIKFPNDYLKGVLYQTLDRPDNKQYRELYAPAAAVEAVRKGQPIPAVFLRGQRASITLDKPGEYNYICGLHPSMKGVIEVK